MAWRLWQPARVVVGWAGGWCSPHVSCSVSTPSAMSVPVLSLVLAPSAALTPALLVLALSLAPALALIVDSAPALSLALALLVSALFPTLALSVLTSF